MKKFLKKLASAFHAKSRRPANDDALAEMRGKTSPLEKYIYLSTLQEKNPQAFYDLAAKHTDEVMPLIYTPTVGEACQKFSHIRPKHPGLHITPEHKGKIRQLLDTLPGQDVRAIVVTDGQRILGLGDLGANGMGIPIGKLALYTICGGVDPDKCLPVMFDVGTNNDVLRNDPAYIGYPHTRLTGAEYDALMEEFIAAVKDKYPKALVQFEDFHNTNAFRLLENYRHKITSFNDDIQGTAAVVLAGIYAANRVRGEDLKNQRIMFLGAGSAATGIADLIVSALQEQGMSAEDARAKLWLVDSKGLVVGSRASVEDHKKSYAHDHAPMDLLDAIKDIKPTMLIGATGTPNTFTREIVETMSALNERPVLFALSNPTSQAECTAEQAYEWSRGAAIFASGSPFAPVEHNGETLKPGQANNAYIFPGLALGVILSEAESVTDEMFLAAAKTLAQLTKEETLGGGTLFPPLKDIRAVSAKIAEAVIREAQHQGLARASLPRNLSAFVERAMYDPVKSAPAQTSADVPSLKTKT